MKHFVKLAATLLALVVFAVPAAAWDYSPAEKAQLSSCLRAAGIAKGVVKLIPDAKNAGRNRPRVHFGGLKKDSQKGKAALACMRQVWRTHNAAYAAGGEGL